LQETILAKKIKVVKQATFMERGKKGSFLKSRMKNVHSGFMFAGSSFRRCGSHSRNLRRTVCLICLSEDK